jgi:catechol 2,3-dioxygenase
MGTGIKIEGVGHVVLKVSDVERSLGFYRDVLGLTEVARMSLGEAPMVFLSTGANHHDVALLEVGAEARRPDRSDIGLFHVALKIGDDLDTLRDAKARLEELGVDIAMLADHTVSQSIYLDDPDGNQIELFVDGDPATWHADPSTVASIAPLAI